jgi:hypothetical protein
MDQETWLEKGRAAVVGACDAADAHGEDPMTQAAEVTTYREQLPGGIAVVKGWLSAAGRRIEDEELVAGDGWGYRHVPARREPEDRP